MKFVDTNILLYAISSAPSEAGKAARAARLLNEDDLALSTQVFQEFYVQATRSAATVHLSHDDAVGFLATLTRFPVQDGTLTLFHAALDVRRRWQIGYWDAAIVAAASALHCDTLYSEDFQNGQNFDGLRVVNPFVES